jgi:hypothetical protein
MDYLTGNDWKPLTRAVSPGTNDWPEEIVRETMDHYGIDRAGALRLLNADQAQCEYWLNNLYQVEVRRFPGDAAVQLNIRRRDGKALYRDWRHFQWIKNQLVGPECEAIELYPAESRMVDTSNKYHLWCCTDPTFRFKVGFGKRDVNYNRTSALAGLKQRAL